MNRDLYTVQQDNGKAIRAEGVTLRLVDGQAAPFFLLLYFEPQSSFK